MSSSSLYFLIRGNDVAVRTHAAHNKLTTYFAYLSLSPNSLQVKATATHAKGVLPE